MLCSCITADSVDVPQCDARNLTGETGDLLAYPSDQPCGSERDTARFPRGRHKTRGVSPARR
jgi:hypothetical protein